MNMLRQRLGVQAQQFMRQRAGNVRQTFQQQTRNYINPNSIGVMSFRKDGLVIGCAISAVIWFGPQDFLAWTLAYLYCRGCSGEVNTARTVSNKQAAFEQWARDRALKNVRMEESGNYGYVYYGRR